MLEIQDIIILMITCLSLIDFLVFSTLFSVYLLNITIRYTVLNVRILSFVILLLFLSLKALHIPIFLSNIKFVKILYIPYTDYIIYTLTWINIILAAIPLIITINTFVKKYFSKPFDKAKYKNNFVCIIMPIYNEKPEALWEAIKSVNNLEYNKKKIHLYLAFDDDKEPEAFLYLIDKYNLHDKINDSKIDIIHDNGWKISICRFPHEGKKSAQNGAYSLIKKTYTIEELNRSYIFFIDSDIILKEDCVIQFMHHMDIHDKTSLTGLITCITSKNRSLLLLYQDIEYISGQIFWRNTENTFGATSCLPGAFTILKFKTFNNISTEYFNKKNYDNTFDYQRFYLGEDRYLTHLLMKQEDWKIGFCEAARCKTEAPETFNALFKQRRRWFLGHISNDTMLLSSVSFWKKYPILTILNFLNNSRNTSIYIYIMYFALLFNKNTSFILWLLFIILPILLNWIFLIYYSVYLNRKINIFSYLIILIFQPIIGTLYMYYTVLSIREKSWGGIRIEKEKQNTDII